MKHVYRPRGQALLRLGGGLLSDCHVKCWRQRQVWVVSQEELLSRQVGLENSLQCALTPSFSDSNRSAAKRRQQMGENRFLQKSAVFCGFLRKSAVSCGFLRKSATPKSLDLQSEPKISENLRSGSGFSFLLSPSWRALIKERLDVHLGQGARYSGVKLKGSLWSVPPPECWTRCRCLSSAPKFQERFMQAYVCCLGLSLCVFARPSTTSTLRTNCANYISGANCSQCLALGVPLERATGRLGMKQIRCTWYFRWFLTSGTQVRNASMRKVHA